MFLFLQIACIKANFSGESLLIPTVRSRASVKTQVVLNKIRIAMRWRVIAYVDRLSDQDEMRVIDGESIIHFILT